METISNNTGKQDLRGETIFIGDRIAYPTRSGSSTFMHVGVVKGYYPDGSLAVQPELASSGHYTIDHQATVNDAAAGRFRGSRRQVKISETRRVVIVRR